jgi:amino-acid N-acetyltransferase
MTPAAALAPVTAPARHPGGPGVFLRNAASDDAEAIHALITEHAAEGRLLPRAGGEIAVHAHRFVVACQDGRIVACAELAPLSRDVSEIRSLVVGEEARGLGLGRELIDELVTRATDAGFEKLCAFTHAPSYFVRLGFSMVPHVWLPEKILTDCHSCPHFRRCGQYAVLRELRGPNQAFVPLTALHG